METININQLQDRASKIIRQIEKGDVVEVVRYSKPVAYLIGRDDYLRLVEQTQCKKCVEDLREIAKNVKAQIPNVKSSSKSK
jgi:prevent-host-death family protein